MLSLLLSINFAFETIVVGGVIVVSAIVVDDVRNNALKISASEQRIIFREVFSLN